MRFASLRVRTGRLLERGVPLLAPLGRLHGALAPIARELRAAPGVKVIAVGGATIGGSGRTALVLSCAECMLSLGARVAVVGHGYRARPGAARVVTTDDSLDAVGDEARMLARALADRAKVVVADRRQDALDLACTRADVVLLDGVLQTSPRRAALSLLAVREDAPWGSGLVMPAGDLRASPGRLRAACDQEVAVSIPLGADVSALRGARVGVITAIARPERLLRSLADAGLSVVVHVDLGDHGARGRAYARHALATAPKVTTWLATPKCAEHLFPIADLLESTEQNDAELRVLPARAVLRPRTLAALTRVASRHSLQGPYLDLL